MLEERDRSKWFVDDFFKKIREQVPNYLYFALPKIIKRWAAGPIKRFSRFLTDWYKIRFDIDSDPAVQYLERMRELHLSQRQGSISKTTLAELKDIIAKGVEMGYSYTQVAKQIREKDPFVFSKSRAKLIAVNEIWRAYWFGSFEPSRVLAEEEGYIMEKLWQTSHDDKVRQRHTANETAWWIPLDKQFPGTWDQYAPSTIDIRCRCTSTTRIVWVKWCVLESISHKYPDMPTIQKLTPVTTENKIKRNWNWIVKKPVLWHEWTSDIIKQSK